MRLAEALKDDQPQESKKYLQQAKDIIDQDSRLDLRAKQWQKLAETFSQS